MVFFDSLFVSGSILHVKILFNQPVAELVASVVLSHFHTVNTFATQILFVSSSSSDSNLVLTSSKAVKGRVNTDTVKIEEIEIIN
jgi:hypothetical protein